MRGNFIVQPLWVVSDLARINTRCRLWVASRSQLKRMRVDNLNSSRSGHFEANPEAALESPVGVGWRRPVH